MKTGFAKSRLLMSIACAVLFSVTCSCNKKSPSKNEVPLSLGQFTEISGVSISPDGNQILFNGCGHQDYTGCTIYRLDRSNNLFYRYIPHKNMNTIYGGRFSPVSNRLTFTILPYDSNQERDYDNSQIAIMNPDGTEFKTLTSGPGLKTRSTLSYNEKKLAFFKSRMNHSTSPLSKQKSKPIGYDLYVLNLQNGIETRLTSHDFYETNDPYFTSDNKKVLYAGDSPMWLPNGDDASKKNDEYKAKYKENIIYITPIDGSKILKELSPHFSYSHGSKMPVLLKDGSILFEGREGIQGYISYHKRTPEGKLEEIKYTELGINDEGKSLVVLYKMTATPDGRYLAMLNHNQNTKQRFLRVFDTRTKKLYNLTLPSECKNIHIQ